VTLEVWDFHDVATRFVPPFAVGLSENFEVIAKGIENAIREGGVMSILQTDSTKIVKNNAKFVGNPLLSISDRAGITIVHPKTVGNAQANGISENFHTWLDKQARELSTYQQKGMDSLSLRRTQKLTAKFVKAKASNDMALMDGVRKQISKTSNGVFFESYQQAIDWLEAVRVKWNNHHHSSLPKIYDEVTGKKRHQSPAECLAAFKADGWQPVVMDEAHIVDLFRPRVQVKVQRGVVKPYGGMRFHHVDLPHWEGKQVVVSYDIMDYSAVTVMAMDGSLICIAPFCETVAYRAMTAYETANEKRALAQIKSKRNQIKTIEQRTGLSLDVIESHGSKVIELQRFDYERVEAAPELQRVEYAVEETAEPKLRTLADLLAEEGDNEEPLSREETVDYLWGDVIDDDDEIKPIEDVL
jgi:putative transposase